MKTALLPFFSALMAFTPVLASQPGSALDCSDWVLAAPGLHCEMAAPLGCTSPSCNPSVLRSPVVVGNAGGIYNIQCSFVFKCGGELALNISVYRLEDGQDVLIGEIEDRCVSEATPGTPAVFDRIFAGAIHATVGSCGMMFDPARGMLLIPLASTPSDPAKTGGYWIAGIAGLKRLSEVASGEE